MNVTARTIRTKHQYAHILAQLLRASGTFLPLTEWSKLQSAVADYIQKGGCISNQTEKQVRDQYNTFQKSYGRIK